MFFQKKIDYENTDLLFGYVALALTWNVPV